MTGKQVYLEERIPLSAKSGNKHYQFIDIAKGICILLMVIGHSGCPQSLKEFIYLFHMPVFFFCSGLLFNLHSAETEPKKYLRKKLTGLWRPFVVYSLVFLAFHNIFYKLCLEVEYYSWKEILLHLVKIPFCFSSQPLLGGFWFLQHLFYANLLLIVVLLIIKTVAPSFNERTWIYLLTLITFLLFIVFSAFYRYTGSFSFYRGQHFASSCTVFLLGVTTSVFLRSKGTARENPFGFFNKRKAVALSAFVLLCILLFATFLIMNTAVRDHLFWQPATILLALAGILFVFILSRIIERKTRFTSRFFAFYGRMSLQILVWHFLAFKAVSAVYVFRNGLPVRMIATHPVIPECADHLGWIVYFLVATTLATVMGCAVESIKQKIGVR